MKKILCFFGFHNWDLKFYEEFPLNTFEECIHCGKKRAGWLR